mmetsp:Transcript_14575/g.49751  ORF Transcript_14575/g.49751 Transcript_14575/m.49751 type:complete len:509 (+) Transcript_14575:222-1748(+)
MASSSFNSSLASKMSLNLNRVHGASSASATSKSGAALVPRTTLFDHAILPVPSNMPNVNQLCEFVALNNGARAGMAQETSISLTSWHKYAKESFKMDTGYAQLVFDIFFDSMCEGNASDASTVSPAPFALFLYVLAVYKDESLIGGTPRALRADIAYPQLTASDSLSPRSSQQLSPRTVVSGSKASELEKKQISFIQKNVKELLHIVSGSASSTHVHPSQFDAMGAILMAPYGVPQSNLSSLVPFWKGKQELVSVSDLCSWISESLPVQEQPSPARFHSSASSPTKVHGESSVIETAAAERSGGFMLHNISRSTIIRSSQELVPNAPSQEQAWQTSQQKWMKIQNCYDSFIYITAPLHHVVITGCVNCTILIAAANLVTMDNCERSKFIFGCRRLHVANSIDTTLHILTNRQPILLGENHDLIVAPFNALLADCLAMWRFLQIDRSKNRWAEALWISRNASGIVLTGGAIPGFSQMPPQNFFLRHRAVQPAPAFLHRRLAGQPLPSAS